MLGDRRLRTSATGPRVSRINSATYWNGGGGLLQVLILQIGKVRNECLKITQAEAGLFVRVEWSANEIQHLAKKKSWHLSANTNLQVTNVDIRLANFDIRLANVDIRLANHIYVWITVYAYTNNYETFLSPYQWALLALHSGGVVNSYSK